MIIRDLQRIFTSIFNENDHFKITIDYDEMKKIILILSLVCFTGSLYAQQVRGYKPQVEGIEPHAVLYGLPMTTLKVEVSCQRNTFVKGVYAEYAQKYLGINATIADSQRYTVTGGSMSYFEEIDPAMIYALDNPEKSIASLYKYTAEGLKAAQIDPSVIVYDRFTPCQSAENLFKDRGTLPLIEERMIPKITEDSAQIGIDRVELIENSIEDRAAAAAKVIFSLRQRRIELITGDAGEYVFGAGLPAALNEIKRLEHEYLALFLGKSFSETIVKEYEIAPTVGKNNIVVCKLSQTAGLVEATSADGSPVTIEFAPEKKTATINIPRKVTKDTRGTIFYRVADIVECRLVAEKSVVAKDRIPIYQFGTVVELPISSLK